MPTRGRREWAAKALHCFLEQTYADKELIIVDDLYEPSFPVTPRRRNVSHVFMDSRLIFEKRNYGARIANGDLICHWDSDDWSAPTRISEQVQHFEEAQNPFTGNSVVAFDSMLFFHEETKTAYYYVGSPLHGIGTSLCYAKSWWKAHPFSAGTRKDPNEGEDGDFCKVARDASQMATRPCDSTMVARMHKGNTSYKNIADPTQMEYRPVGLGKIPEGFFL